MRSNEPTVFLVWDFSFEFPQLRAVDTCLVFAKAHRDFLVKKGKDAKIETCSANHLFAENCLGTLDRIKKRKEL